MFTIGNIAARLTNINLRLTALAVFVLPLVVPAATLNENCVVSVLNRTVQVKADGTWLLPNVPAGFGPVKARATCVNGGITTSGESAYFTILPNGGVDVPPISLGAVTPVPTALAVTSPVQTFTQLNQTAQLVVVATYPGNVQKNVTAVPGTTYTVSNPALATVSNTGLVIAKASGTVIVQALNEGRPGILSLSIVLTGDRDNDGIADDVEIREGLDPNNPTDAVGDRDQDGLNNREELRIGTNINNPDSDGDGLTDGAEVNVHKTSPLLKDTDGDGVPDNVEIATGSNPNLATSFNLAQALSKIEITPTAFVINVNSVQGLGFQQLTVTGTFKAGGTIDLTAPSRGTNYSSNNLGVCSFGAEAGRVFGGSDGNCTITVTNSGFTAQSSGVVKGFSPVALGSVAIPGFANAVAVNGNYAYVAAGATGLQIVNTANKANPTLVGTVDTPGNANGVAVAGNFAYVADGAAGLQIINIANPAAPVAVGTLATAGEAKDVVVRSGRAYVAMGSAGLAIINVAVANSPALLGSIDTPGQGKGVAVDINRNLAVVADGSSGLRIINIANPASPVALGFITQGLSDARDVAFRGNSVVVADYNSSMSLVDLTNPASPLFQGSANMNLGGRLNDIAVNGNLAVGADVFFVNGVPIVDAGSSTLAPRAILNFPGDYDGQGVAADSSYVYMTGVAGSHVIENGTNGSSRLFIGQYLALEDKGGVPPTVSIVSPTPGASAVAGTTIPVTAEANDDIQVVAVTLIVNGQDFAVDTSAPFEFTLPTTVQGVITLAARAIDLGGNATTSAAVSVNIIPDPLTRVTGRVTNQNAPLAGAQVQVLTLSTTSGADGTFAINNVPTVGGNLTVTASAMVSGRLLRGSSAAKAPVLAGTTNVGDIALKGGKIGLLHCDSAGGIVNNMVSTGQISSADIVELPRCSIPTLSQLQEISALLVWSNSSFSSPDALGNVLADYVDQGGGLVLATYVFSSSWRVGGRIMTPGYSPFLVGSPVQTSGSLSLANSNTAHPIMQGVAAGPYFTNFNYSDVPLSAGSTVIAVDTAGVRTVAVNSSNRVVGINVFPGYGDMGRLFANALNFVR
jgi:hypothetical protein